MHTQTQVAHTERIPLGRKAAFPDAEKKLHAQFIAARKERKKLKHWWFISRMRQLLSELYDEKAEAFCRRYKVALRTKTHRAQKAPESVVDDVTRLHKTLLGNEVNSSHRT